MSRILLKNFTFNFGRNYSPCIFDHAVKGIVEKKRLRKTAVKKNNLNLPTIKYFLRKNPA